ncbi:dof zinc finger protein DOF1.7 [Brachypodium distachyon]|uniref:Dof zinc finger protein n=1 Tax=Brachypodium distachyon TaxID=15368 RepID=I1J3D7_BRADI|nr:dof zinc finger protein DOF1.7 [Brachypodium distachyon]KQJ85311.1 hypothetical protein BRADI_5g26240v3 [Brachypodium distachyon]|eukprot:XP_003580828.1 dof zinc finger protein DOF1.7 [Brachypodium distachyon]
MAPDAAATGKLPDQAPPLLAQGDHHQAGAGNGNGKQQQLVECPRCGSGNTKFCYYNNYSTAQPRHFCRACRRYWTHGGSLRNVPVGGACRRRDAAASGNANKRRRASSSDSGYPSSSSAEPPSSAAQDQLPPPALTFPFLSDGTAFFLPPPPQYDISLGAGSAAAAFSWPLYDGGLGAAPWDDGTLSGAAAGAATGAWGNVDEFTGLDLSWPPASGN